MKKPLILSLILFLFAFTACNREAGGSVKIAPEENAPVYHEGADKGGAEENEGGRICVIAYETGYKILSETEENAVFADGKTNYNEEYGVSYSVKDEYIAFAFENAEEITGYAVWNGYSARLFGVKTGGANKYHFFYGDTLHCGVTVSVSDLSEIRKDGTDGGFSSGQYSVTERLTIQTSDGENSWLFGRNFDGDDLALYDGAGGTYYSDEFGTASIDGFGTLTFGDEKYRYKISENTVFYIFGEEERTMYIDKSEKTFSFPTDGYEGEYSGDGGAMVLDGHGVAKLGDEAGTYTVDGENLIATINGKKYFISGEGYTEDTFRIYFGKTYEADTDLFSSGENKTLAFSFSESGDGVTVCYGEERAETEFSENGESVGISVSLRGENFVFSLAFSEDDNSFYDEKRDLKFFRC